MNRNATRLFLLLVSSQFAHLSLAASPYPDSDVITGVSLDWSTHQRFAQGSDNFQLTWADDDNLYGAWGDGGGFGGSNGRGRVGIGIARIEGSPPNIHGVNVWGGDNRRHPATFEGKSWGMISVHQTLYMWVVPDTPDGKNYRNHYEYIRGLDTAHHPLWGTLAEKRPVFEDPNGVGWCMSASYNPFFDRILLCTEHDHSTQGTIGIFDAPTPWGPWTSVKYFDRSSPFGAARKGSQLPWSNNVFFVAFATKWIDRNTFVLNFTGAGRGSDNDSFNTVRGRFRSEEGKSSVLR